MSFLLNQLKRNVLGGSMEVHRLNVLILNEDANLIEKMANTLQAQGFETHAAHTQAEAKRLMATTRFDVLVTDVTMPENDGIKLSKSVCGKIPIVLLTAGSGGEVMARNFGDICDCFLDKREIGKRLGQATWKAFQRFKIDRQIVRDLKLAA